MANSKKKQKQSTSKQHNDVKTKGNKITTPTRKKR